MPALSFQFGTIVAVVCTIAVVPASAQQQVIVTVSAVPNPVAPGSCATIVTDVRDEQNRQLVPDNGGQLRWSFTNGNGADFHLDSLTRQLCARSVSAAVTTQVSATLTEFGFTGTTIVAADPSAAVASQPAAAPTVAVIPPASPAALPTQPYIPPAQVNPQPAAAPTPDPSAATTTAYQPQPSPPTPYASPVQPTTAYSPPVAPAAAPPQPAPVAPAQPAAAPAPAAAPPPQQVATQPVKSPGGFFKKIGSHIKQRAAEVKAETSQNLTAAATQIVDTTFQTGAKLVASTTAEVSNTARMGIGGVAQKLMLVPQRSGGAADNLSVAVASGRAVLPEVRFTPGTSVLEPSGRELVNRLGVELRNEMARAPGILFEIYAHVDSGPSAQVLSEERAAAVKAVLANFADAKRMTALGYGASQPIPGGPGSRIEVVRCNDGQTKCSWR